MRVAPLLGAIGGRLDRFETAGAPSMNTPETPSTPPVTTAAAQPAQLPPLTEVERYNVTQELAGELEADDPEGDNASPDWWARFNAAQARMPDEDLIDRIMEQHRLNAADSAVDADNLYGD